MRLGVKAHWKDVAAMAALAGRHGAGVLEYQMLPGDLEAHAEAALEAFAPYRSRFELRVHQPDAFLDDAGALAHLDIASPDRAVREASARALRAVAAHAEALGATALIAHPGGIWRGNVGGGVELLRASLEGFPRRVPLLLENMPCFYAARWSADVELGAPPAAFRMPQGLARVDDLVDGYAFDVSHAYLCVAGGSREMPRAFVRDLGARIRHVHASGSRAHVGPDGEGTPFSDSDYDAAFVRELVAALPPDVVVVPEIMHGHRDGGRGFEDAFLALRG